MIDARQIVARHRNSEASVPSGEEWTLGAVVEHIVWLGSNSLPALPNTKWWSLLNSSGWPKADAKSVSCDGCVVAILPLSYDLVFLRNVEQDIRTRSTNSGFDTKMAKALSGAIAEIITNVWEHAQATTPALLAYECSGERLIASITDLGIGVLSSLRSNPGYAQLSSSLQALREAMRVGVSRHTVEGRGYGFNEVLLAVADHGSVRLRSGEGILEFRGSPEVRNALGSYGVDLPGLHVAISCGPAPKTVHLI